MQRFIMGEWSDTQGSECLKTKACCTAASLCRSNLVMRTEISLHFFIEGSERQLAMLAGQTVLL